MSMRNALFPAPDGAKARDPRQMAPLALAYVGDTVYDLYVRTRLVDTLDATPHGLHMASAKLVCAAGQALAFSRVQPMLTQEELLQFKRGRNAHSGTVPKNATISDYRTASGFEALIGYLYLSGEDARVREIMTAALTATED